MVLAVTNDLMATAPIEHAARQVGATCRTASTTQLAEFEIAEPPRVVVLDLGATDDVAGTVEAIRKVAGALVPIIAFGPHVHAATLQAAADAGCAQVLTRGQFHRDMVAVLGGFLNEK